MIHLKVIVKLENHTVVLGMSILPTYPCGDLRGRGEKVEKRRRNMEDKLELIVDLFITIVFYLHFVGFNFVLRTL